MARPCLSAAPQRQRGAMSVTLLLVMIGLVAMLGLVEIGYLYWAKRDAQKVADLAAIAGAQRLDLCNASHSDNTAARRNAEIENRFAGTLAVQCGSWKATHPATDHFLAGSSAQHPLNAVKVVTRRSVVPFFGQNTTLPTVSGQAVAKRSAPTAVFSVGSQLLRVNGNTPLGNTLRLVGVDLDQTTLLGYDGLAQARITPAGLLQALGIPVDANLSVGDFNALLAAHQVSLGQLLDASASLLSRTGFASIDLGLLKRRIAAKMDVDQLVIKLGSDASGSGLFAHVVSPDGVASSALQADLGVLDLISAGVAIAAGDRGVDVNDVGLPGLKVSARIVEPPSIAIGGVGSRAYNAQVRVFADIDTNQLPAVGGLLGLLGTRLQLPLYLDVTNAMGTLTSLHCGSTPPTATIKVESSLLRACVGKVSAADRYSKQNVCDAGLQDEQLLTLLGAPLIRRQIKVNALPTPPDQQDLTLAAGETGSTRVNPLALGNTVAELTSQLLGVLAGTLDPSHNGMSTTATAEMLADRYLLAGVDPGTTKYNIERTISYLQYGSAATDLKPLGTWNIPKGVPEPCLIGLLTCFRDGTVWEGFRATVSGQGNGLVPGLLGTLLGGLVINRCSSLLGNYNECVKKNLASYIQTNTDKGFLDPANGGGVTAPGNAPVACTGLLCIVLKPALDLLKPLLNSIGALVSNLLTSLLGLELGRTDVHVQSIQCSSAQLVY